MSCAAALAGVGSASRKHRGDAGARRGRIFHSADPGCSASHPGTESMGIGKARGLHAAGSFSGYSRPPFGRRQVNLKKPWNRVYSTLFSFIV